MKQIKIQPFNKTSYIVTEAFSIRFGGKTITIPKGFVTDGNSTFISRFSPRYVTASIIHDWLYFTGEVTRLEADQIYFIAMKNLNTNKILRGIFYIGVRLFGGLAWRNHRKN